VRHTRRTAERDRERNTSQVTGDPPARRVLVINQFALPRDQGGGTRHIDLFGRVPGWTARIIAADTNHYTQETFATSDRHFSLVRLPRWGRSSRARVANWILFTAGAFARSLRLRPYDVVVASTPHLLAPLAGLAAARLARVPFVLEVRDLWPESLVSAGTLRSGSAVHRLLMRLESALVTGASHLIVVTPGWEEHFVSLGADPGALSVIANGADLDAFNVTADRDRLRRKHGISGFTAIFAGAHGPKDGIELILDAALDCPDTNFLLIGDGPIKERAIQLAAERHLANVTFRPPVRKAALPELLAACDLGVHSVTPLPVFQRGMSPNKLLDYMAAGLPVVSNAGEAIRGIVRDGECGSVGDSTQLADCIREVRAASPEQRREWGRAARSIAETRYSRREAALALATVLNNLADGSNGGTR
jgi:glycosyltransferase involved in cell wall biosynthesis